MKKEDIEDIGLSSEYINYQANAIVKEMKKENIDLAYIREKVQSINGFLDEIESSYINYSMEEETDDFCRKIKSEHEYTITSKNIDYSIGGRDDYVKIPSETFTNMLWYVLDNKMTKEEKDNIEDLWIKTGEVGCGHTDFPIDQIESTGTNAIGLEVKENCPKELEEKIRNKTEYWFEKLVDEIRDLYDRLKNRYYESIKETVQNE